MEAFSRGTLSVALIGSMMLVDTFPGAYRVVSKMRPAVVGLLSSRTSERSDRSVKI